MNRIVGFAVHVGLTRRALKAQTDALCAALRHFPWLNRLSSRYGAATLELWGHGDLAHSVHHMHGGDLLVLIGSPAQDISWLRVLECMSSTSGPEDFELPWDGRVILLRLSPDGKDWAMWNDFCGSIPVFHAQIGEGRIASTLEPVVVAAAGYTPNDIFPPSLVSLLINGQYLGEWTLFRDMRVVPSDCVAEWQDERFCWKRLWTVRPSDARWDRGWDELADEMYALSHQAIAAVLKTQSSWILPLSGGLDSRLIAAVGASMGVDLRTYTYGPSTWNEPIFARQVSKVLSLPWKGVDLGTHYLARYTQMWADWFGSSLGFHGMYQASFLESLSDEPPGPLLHGFMGDALTGNRLLDLIATHSNQGEFRVLSSGHWTGQEVKSLLKFSVHDALKQVSSQIRNEIDPLPGAWFQRLMLFHLHNRLRFFISYHPMMYDYWRGVATPFFNREYARFCLSLPRLALEERQLLREMYCRHYPHLAAISSTYYGRPFLLTPYFLIKRKIARHLPGSLCLGPLREFKTAANTMDQDCIRATGQAAVWPIFEARDRLCELVNMDVVEEAYKAAMAGDLQAVSKLEAVQTLAYRLLDTQSQTTSL